MVTPVLMPQLGLEVSEGTVTAILVELGAEVVRDQPLIELETDKAITEVVAPSGGVVRAIEVSTGDTVPVGAVLVQLAATLEEPLVAERAPEEHAAAAIRREVAVTTPAPEPPRIRVAPVARRAAADLGVDLAGVTGTGPRGRITLNDVRGAAGANGSTPPPPEAARPDIDVDHQPLSAMRRAIARRMTASQLIPQYHLVRDVDASHLMAEKAAQASRRGEKVGLNDLLVQAIAETAIRHPSLAMAYVEGDGDTPPSLLARDSVDVGLAVATDRGLVVPVIRAAHERGIADIAGERRRLVAAARAGRLALEEMTGGTITLSSLAGFGIDRFTAMVNPGESAIVAVGRMVDRLVPRGRSIASVPTLTMTLSFDHRVVDGAVGAAALAELAELLEGAMTWRP